MNRSQLTLFTITFAILSIFFWRLFRGAGESALGLDTYMVYVIEHAIYGSFLIISVGLTIALFISIFLFNKKKMH